jgi:hypothetical protein
MCEAPRPPDDRTIHLEDTAMKRASIALLLALAGAPALAQGFPEGATVPAAADLKKHLDGRVFDVKIADGSSWRLEYNARGHYFVNVSTGFNGTGSWRTEEGKLCTHPRGSNETCNDVRMHSGLLHLKRTSGEMIRLVPR